MAECWARCLGDCDDKISREHLITGGLWKGPTVRVVGLPWCKEEPQEIGLGGFTSKILCRRHNSSLSELDAAAVDAFETIQKALVADRKRRKLRRRRWKLARFEIDGPKLERWFLKTTINLAHFRSSGTKWSHAPDEDPPSEFVRMTFGLEPIAKPMGLYGSGTRGEELDFSNRVEFSTLLDPNRALRGALFTFRGLRFGLWLSMDPIPESLQLQSHGATWSAAGLHYHLARIQWKVGRWISHYIHIMWPVQSKRRRA